MLRSVRSLVLAPLLAPLLVLLLTAPAAALAQGAPAAGPSHVELILDASGSMFNKLADGRYRIVAAKEVLAELVAALPADADLNVGYRAYGSELQATAAGSCEDSRLYVPIEGVDRQLLLTTVRNTQARGATPIAYSLERALEDLDGRTGERIVVLITDGEEGCGGDVRAAAQALKDAGIDLRIIGFDLDELARASFDGLGAFENATSAAELLAALNRAVEAAAAPVAPATYPVRVTLTRDGEPAEDGASVAFQPALGAEADAAWFAAEAGGVFRTELPAGGYVARVADALSAEPLVVSGLAVTPEGPNEFAFELAPRLDVTLTPETVTPNAGATLTIAWEGAPSGGGYIALVPAGLDALLRYEWAEGPAGELAMRLPAEAAEYELRFLVDQPGGTTHMLGVTSIETQPVTVTLEAPAETTAGQVIEVVWHGPDNAADYVTIVPVGTPEGAWGAYEYTERGNPLALRTPQTDGEYEIRYNDGFSDVTLATLPLTLAPASGAIRAPAEASAGSVVAVEVVEPSGDPTHYVTIVRAGAPATEWTDYAYVHDAGTFELLTPEEPGEYEVRYVTEEEYIVLASVPISLYPLTASLQAPETVVAGQRFPVFWESTGYWDDFVTIVPAGAPEGDWGDYAYVADGSPLELTAPEEPGRYEVRYLTGRSYSTVASQPIEVR